MIVVPCLIRSVTSTSSKVNRFGVMLAVVTTYRPSSNKKHRNRRYRFHKDLGSNMVEAQSGINGVLEAWVSPRRLPSVVDLGEKSDHERRVYQVLLAFRFFLDSARPVTGP